MVKINKCTIIDVMTIKIYKFATVRAKNTMIHSKIKTVQNCMQLQIQFELKLHCLYSVVHWHLTTYVPVCLGLRVIHQWRLLQLYLHTALKSLRAV